MTALVENFVEVRADGKLVQEDGPWPAGGPCLVVNIRWTAGGTAHELGHNDNGYHAKVLSDRTGLCVITDGAELRILNSDASLRTIVRAHVPLLGRILPGTFAWFETPRLLRNGVLGAVIQTSNGPYQVDIDADLGVILSAHETR